jgi:antitoxin YefM
MNALSYSQTRANLKEAMDRVVEDHTPLLITRQNGEAVVMVSLADWRSMEETAYLLASPANAKALRDSIARLNAGLGEEHELIQP